MGLKLFDEVNMLAAKDTDAAKPLPGQWSDYVVTCRTLGIQINHLQSPKTPAQHPESQFSTANNTEVVTRTPVLPYVSPRVTQLSHCGFPWTRGSIRTAELSPSLVLEPSGLPPAAPMLGSQGRSPLRGRYTDPRVASPRWWFHLCLAARGWAEWGKRMAQGERTLYLATG
jgi:hypothetical protein